MRHYFYVNAAGEILGPATRRGGFKEDHCLTDPECAHPMALAHRESAAAIPTFDRFVDYDCACPGEELECTCAYDRLLDTYADGQTLVTKAPLTLLVDGAAFDPETDNPVRRPAGTSITFKIQASAPDGHQVVARPFGTTMILPSPTPMTFSEGETEVINLVAPAVGMVGTTGGSSKYVRQFIVRVCGT